MQPFEIDVAPQTPTEKRAAERLAQRLAQEKHARELIKVRQVGASVRHKNRTMRLIEEYDCTSVLHPSEPTRSSGMEYFSIGREDELENRVANDIPDRPWLWPSWIVLFAIGAVAAMELLAGLEGLGVFEGPSQASPPEQGDGFNDGSQDFTQTNALLQQAVPAAWQGEATDAHRAAHATLTALTQQMADMDLQSKMAVKQHSDCVFWTQIELAAIQVCLLTSYYLVWKLENNADTLLAAYAVAIGVTLSALATGIYLLVTLWQDSERAAQQADGIEYTNVTTAAQQIVAAYRSEPAESNFANLPTEATHFADGPVSTSALSAIANTPAVASALHRVGGSAPSHTPLAVASDAPARLAGQTANAAARGSRLDQAGRRSTPNDALRANQGEDDAADLDPSIATHEVLPVNFTPQAEHVQGAPTLR